MGLFLASYWRKYLLTGQEQHLERAKFCASCWRIMHHRDTAAPAGATISTGPTGALRRRRNADYRQHFLYRPAFLDLVNLTAQYGIRIPSSKVESVLAVAGSACDFIMNDLNRIEPAPDEVCFSYTPLDRRYVHNANVLGAQLLAGTYAHTQERQLAEMALYAARYTARRQEPNGSWKYGEWGRMMDGQFSHRLRSCGAEAGGGGAED
jgi:hypothetical protein